jgi:hypothetical protein
MTYKYNSKTALVPIITVLLVVGFLVTSLASFFVSRASLREEISYNELPLTSDNIYSEIQRDLLTPIFISSTMAIDTFLRDWVLNGEIGPEHIVNYLSEIKQRYNTVTSFFVSDITMNYYYADGILKTVSPDEPRDEWYFRVKNMEDDYEINVDPDMANQDRMTIFINYKVYDYNQNYIGATGVGLTISSVKELIEKYQRKYGRTIYFFNEDGEIKLSGKKIKHDKKHISSLSYHKKLKELKKSRQEQRFTFKKDKRLVHANIRHIKEFKWFLVVEQPEGEALKEIYTTLIINLLICIAITMIVLYLVSISVSSYKKRIETLRGIVPICSYCKQIRDDKGYWNKVEKFIAEHTEAEFTHSICPDCMKEHFPEYSDEDEK